MSGYGVNGDPVLIRQVEVVLAFGDAVAGVELVALAAGETAISATLFEESAITATADNYKLGVFADGIEAATLALNGGAPVDEKIGLNFIPVGIGPIRDATLIVKVSGSSSGTWTAGSVRVVALVGAPA